MRDELRDVYIKNKLAALVTRSDAIYQARRDFREGKSQLDTIHRMSVKTAVDKATRELVKEAYKEAIKYLEKARDSAESQAMSVFTIIWHSIDTEYNTPSLTQLESDVVCTRQTGTHRQLS